MTNKWTEEQIDDLEAEQARVTAMAEHETDTWISIAFRDRLSQIKLHLRDLKGNAT